MGRFYLRILAFSGGVNCAGSFFPCCCSITGQGHDRLVLQGRETAGIARGVGSCGGGSEASSPRFASSQRQAIALTLHVKQSIIAGGGRRRSRRRGARERLRGVGRRFSNRRVWILRNLLSPAASCSLPQPVPPSPPGRCRVPSPQDRAAERNDNQLEGGSAALPVLGGGGGGGHTSCPASLASPQAEAAPPPALQASSWRRHERQGGRPPFLVGARRCHSHRRLCGGHSSLLGGHLGLGHASASCQQDGHLGLKKAVTLLSSSSS
ncbi:uncharacterized protein LOC122455512 [Dermochelys coriacea]|uniref:uncharacterized protein LOC122455512 n=1 Tax=Dermochelys coriacea TaxID=27794 RepID=UPI001CA94BA2|nr:uncharacterized protein LOC122455512 [Dermochelys coriacea]